MFRVMRGLGGAGFLTPYPQNGNIKLVVFKSGTLGESYE